MNRLLLASAALLSFVAIASASAANAQAAPPQEPSKAVPTWTGYYVGVHAGGSWSHLDIVDIGNGNGASYAFSGTAGQDFSTAATPVPFGGFQAGYDFQSDSLVYGVEADLGWLDLHETAVDPGSSSSTLVGVNRGAYENFTGRVGKPFGHDSQYLLFARAGLALYDGKEAFTTNAGTTPPHSDVDVFPGIVAGAGLEYRMHSRWSGKIEYQHTAYAYRTFDVTGAAGTSAGTFPFRLKLSTDALSAGLNYRWGTGKAKKH